ncbi:hypothetical protein FHP05_04680 [Cerasibacillus terrae]|uniref:ATP-grasp domain-containing protein n=1 Tax=Cerasibacillus terrae TaxID=2498845 RepID=A0A5C8P068_9BACI|nr:YheC/YheD family protein [Cerasibacillus terrae]TXL66683.1 hypothetical protein FHP05_04680 [Cerasibacillus terrae]
MDKVGFFRWNIPYKSTMMIYAIIGKHYGLDMIFFDDKGVNMENEKITGYVLRDNKFIKTTSDIPKIINNTPYKSNNRELHTFLSNKSHFMFKPFGGKMKEYRYFEKESILKDILIPSTRIKNKKHVLYFLKQNKKAIFKPLYSDKGKGIFTLERISDDKFIYESENKNKIIYEDNFLDFYKEFIRKKGLLMSQFIEFKTKNGHPFDIRINFEKDYRGKWCVAQRYARVGFNNKITSNLSAGGGTAKLKSFLKTEYNSSDEKKINDQLKGIIELIPDAVEKMVNFEINSIGLDLGIDRDKKIYMFEINSYPGISNALGQVALLRTGYMRYYLDKNK